MSNYAFERGLYKVWMKHGNDLPDDQCGDARFKMMAVSTLMRRVFYGLYNFLVKDNEMKPVEEMPQDYQTELRGIANQFMPMESEESKDRYRKAIMATLWLMNNE